MCRGGVYLVQGVVPGPRGVYLVPGGCTWSGGAPGPWGVHLVLGGAPGPGGVYLVQGAPGPGGVPGQVLPPMDRITDACKNITLPELHCRW